MSAAPEQVGFSLDGWTPAGEQRHGANSARRWTDEHADTLSLHHFPEPDPIPSPAGDLEAFRAFCREIATGNGSGLLEAEMLDAGSRTFYRSIYKYPLDAGGFVFSGGLWLSPHYVVNVEAAEGPMTGLREAGVATLLGADAQPGLWSRMVRGAERWCADPYDRRREGACFKSDMREWDEHFPDHALSRVRRALAVVESSVTFDCDVG